MIIASIAMEELALSHIINAEGEKLQYILGTLPGSRACAGPQDVLAVNKSVASLLDVVAQNQMLLKNKLEKALEACPPPAPPCPPPYPGDRPPHWGTRPPPCPPNCGTQCRPPCCGAEAGPKCALHLTGPQAGHLWGPGCRLPWRQKAKEGDCIGWNEHNPTQIRLDPRETYAIQCRLNVYAMPPAKGDGAILLRQTPSGAFSEAPPLFFSLEQCAEHVQTLQYAAVLYPCIGSAGRAELSLVLDTRNALCVEQAAMDVVQIS